MAYPFISVIIPFTEWNDEVFECITHCAELDYPDFDVRLAPNAPPDKGWADKIALLDNHAAIHVLPTGPANPSHKRNAVLKTIDSEYVALVDSDAYPQREWLRQGLRQFSDAVAIVTGPNLTPPDDPLMRRIAGYVMQSRWGFWEAYIRHCRVPRRLVREMPTCNMIFKRLPGVLFHEELDTGEDMVFCEEYIKLGKQIVYDPDVVVYHHRRRIFAPFIKQFFYYGYYKGRLCRQGSSVAYGWQALPAFFTLYLVLLLLISPGLARTAWLGWCYLPLLGYLVIIGAASSAAARSGAEFVLTVMAFVCGHLGYGVGYLRGYLWAYGKRLVDGFRKDQPAAG